MLFRSRDLAALPGYGHGVYKAKDPRRDILHQIADTVAHHQDGEVLKEFNLYETIESVGLEVVNEKREAQGKGPIHLPVNVDFWSGFVLAALDIPAPLFPAMFALGRSAGWVYHSEEQHQDPRLQRPGSHLVLDEHAKDAVEMKLN